MKVVLLEQSKEIDWVATVEEIQQDYNTLNGIILVHTIFTENRSVYDVSFDEFNQVMYEHVWGTYLGIRTLRPMLKDERDAKIINVIEPSFEDVFERNLYYTVTGAIEALTHSTAAELRKVGCRCVCDNHYQLRWINMIHHHRRRITQCVWSDHAAADPQQICFSHHRGYDGLGTLLFMQII